MTTRYCTNCGQPIVGDNKFCSNCGTPVPPLPYEPKPQPEPQPQPQPEPQPVENTQPIGPKPTSYLALAILATIFCCLPFGIVSIVKAAKVDSLWNAGNYIESQEASRKARNWAIAAILSAVVVAILYFVFFMIIGVSAFGLGELLEELS